MAYTMSRCRLAWGIPDSRWAGGTDVREREEPSVALTTKELHKHPQPPFSTKQEEEHQL